MASLNSCKSELRSIIRELRNIENDVRYGGSAGIGQDLCGDCIGRIAEKYDEVLRRLERVNMNHLASWIMKED